MAENTFQQLNAMFKEVYGDKIQRLVPENVKLQKDIPFTEARMLGKSYEQPVVLSNSQGFTYGDPDDDVFDLNEAVASEIKRASIQGYQIVLRDVVGYKALASAPSKGKKAFLNATRYVVENMVRSMRKRVEIAMLYGQSGIGQASGSTNVNTTSTVVQFTDGSWAPGIWAGAENARIEFWDSNDSQVSSGSDGVFTVTSVDNANKTVTVTGSSAGITALDGATNTPLDAYYQSTRTGSSAYKEMAGLDRIITNTGSLFGIDASNFALWKGNTVNAGGNLSFDVLNEAIGEAVARGGLDTKVCAFVSPKTWAFLNDDEAALRSYDQSYSNGEARRGNQQITYFSQNGEVEIKPHIYVKEGEAFIVPLEHTYRVGARDISFNLGDGHDNENFFQELQDKTGFQLRNYTDQAVYVDRPATTAKITGITNA